MAMAISNAPVAFVPFFSMGTKEGAGTYNWTIDKTRFKMFFFLCVPLDAGGGSVEFIFGANSIGTQGIAGTGASGSGLFVFTYDSTNDEYDSHWNLTAGTGGTHTAYNSAFSLVITGNVRVVGYAGANS